jgi:hypothetical protein
VDVFHDTIESLGQSADRDLATLRAAGFEAEEVADGMTRFAVR